MADSPSNIRLLRSSGSARPATSPFLQQGESGEDYFRRLSSRPGSRPANTSPRSYAPPDFLDFNPSLSSGQWGEYWHGEESSPDPEHEQHRANVEQALDAALVTPDMYADHPDVGMWAALKDGNVSARDLLSDIAEHAASMGHNKEAVVSDVVAMMKGDRPSALMKTPAHAEIVEATRNGILNTMRMGAPGQAAAAFDPRTPEEQASLEQRYGESAKWKMEPGTQENFDRQRAYGILRATSDSPDHRPSYASGMAVPLTFLSAGFDSSGASDPVWKAMATRSGPNERMWMSNYWAERGRPELNQGFYKSQGNGSFYPEQSITTPQGLMAIASADESHPWASVFAPDQRVVTQASRGGSNRAIANEILGYGNRGQPLLPPGVPKEAAQEFGNIVHNVRRDDVQNQSYFQSFWPEAKLALAQAGQNMYNAERMKYGLQPEPQVDESSMQYGYAPGIVDSAISAGQSVVTPYGIAMAGTGGLRGGMGALKSAAGKGAASGVGAAARGALTSTLGHLGAEAGDELREDLGMGYLDSGDAGGMLSDLLTERPTNELMTDDDGNYIPAGPPSVMGPARRDARERQEAGWQQDKDAYLRIKKR
jgi:hypothetical protein